MDSKFFYLLFIVVFCCGLTLTLPTVKETVLSPPPVAQNLTAQNKNNSSVALQNHELNLSNQTHVVYNSTVPENKNISTVNEKNISNVKDTKLQEKERHPSSSSTTDNIKTTTIPTSSSSSSSSTSSSNITSTVKTTFTPPSIPTTVKPTTSNNTIPTTPSNNTISTTPSNNTIATTPSSKITTAFPISTHDRQFDGPSFFGGIVLAAGLTAICFIAFKYYKSGKLSRNYRTL